MEVRRQSRVGEHTEETQGESLIQGAEKDKGETKVSCTGYGILFGNHFVVNIFFPSLCLYLLQNLFFFGGGRFLK
jgi:hypothetical protein